jgi:hypothetical protein
MVGGTPPSQENPVQLVSMARRAVVAAVPAIMLIALAPMASAHQSGCHAAHSCPSDTGSYICGDTGNFTFCGGMPVTSPIDLPPAPPAGTTPIAPISSGVAPTVDIISGAIEAGEHTDVLFFGDPGQTLHIWSKTQPALAYSLIRTIVLDDSGMNMSSFAPTRNTRLLAKTDGGLTSPAPLIQVGSRISLNVKRIGTRSYNFSGRVYPARVGRLVSVYRDLVLCAQARTNATGVYSVNKTMASGFSFFSAHSGSDTYNLGSDSPDVFVDVH